MNSSNSLYIVFLPMFLFALGVCLKVFTGHRDMVINFEVKCFDTPIPIQMRSPQPADLLTRASTSKLETVFETSEADLPLEGGDEPTVDVVDTFIVSVSDDNTAKVFVFSTLDLANAQK